MHEQHKLIIKNMQDVKKRKAVIIAASLVMLVGIVAVNNKINADEEIALDASLVNMVNEIDEDNIQTFTAPDPEFMIKIAVDNKNIELISSGTVADALNKANVNVSDDDLINIGFHEKLNPNTSIVINRVTFKEEVYIETIDYATEYKEDKNLTLGHSKVIVDGEEGEVEQVIQHTYIDGELVASSVISEEVTEPVDEVVALGIKEEVKQASTSPDAKSVSKIDAPSDLELDENGIPVNYTTVHTGRACAYTAPTGSSTSTGKAVRVGYVAVNPDIIPYGSELYIVTPDGSRLYGYAIAADTGGSCLRNDILIDLFMATEDECYTWGSRTVNVYVLS